MALAASPELKLYRYSKEKYQEWENSKQQELINAGDIFPTQNF
jgi:hypothetical protein